MSFTQLVTPLPISIIDKGKGIAFAVIDYGPEHNLIWVTAMDDTGEIWCAPNPLVRLRDNWTMGRTSSTPSGLTSPVGPGTDQRPDRDKSPETMMKAGPLTQP